MRAKKVITAKEALARLEELCARAEHSAGEMYEKLHKWQIAPDEADKIVESLIKHRYVDDLRFARAYINDKVKMARWGRRKVQQGLYLKRIDREIIRKVMDEIDEQLYIDNLDYTIKAKIKSSPQLIESFEGRTKIFRFLISRGYEPSIASERLKTALKSQA